MLRLLIIGAHPDDADYSAGGLATMYPEAARKLERQANGVK